MEQVAASVEAKCRRTLALACATIAAVAAGNVGAATPGGDVAGHCVYVTNETSGDLTVIDGTRLAAVATVALGKRPRGLQLSADGRLLYVALSGSPLAPPG